MTNDMVTALFFAFCVLCITVYNIIKIVLDYKKGGDR